MDIRISDRHEGTAGGTLLPFSDTRRVSVTVRVEPATAGMAATQHTAWMLVNLLARLDGVVNEVLIDCPPDVPLAGRIVPLTKSSPYLHQALLEGVSAIGVVPVRNGVHQGRVLVVGALAQVKGADFFVVGNAWCGGISKGLTTAKFDSELPFGPYVAACLAVGEIFKSARLGDSYRSQDKSIFYSLWTFDVAATPSFQNGPRDLDCKVDAGLAGVGAVGTAFLHTMWATPGLGGRLVTADNDLIDDTNLNRCSLFGRDSVGCPKASEAARVLAGTPLLIQAHDDVFETLQNAPPRVVSAVDRNSSRARLQDQYYGGILSASTLDLRAEVLRCGPPGIGACLRCYNTPERPIPDVELRANLSKLPDAELRELTGKVGLSLEDGRAWIAKGGCGVAGERLLPLLRRDEDEILFSVGFVSVLAGTMLAAALVKDIMHSEVPLNDSRQRAVFQFLRPLALTNSAKSYPRDKDCPKCVPGSVATQIWQERFQKVQIG